MPFTPIESSLGAVLLGLSINAHLLFHGRVTGISKIKSFVFKIFQLGMSGAVAAVARYDKTHPEEWYLKFSYLVGLLLGGVFLTLIPEFAAQAFNTTSVSIQNEQWIYFIVCGFLVGFGTQLGSGCTSGHMLCGLARLSRRSFIAVLSFCGTCFFFVKFFNTPKFISKIYQIPIESFSISYPNGERLFYMISFVIFIFLIYGLIVLFQNSISKTNENLMLHLLNGFVFGVGLGFAGMTSLKLFYFFFF